MSSKKEKPQETYVKHPELKGLLILSACIVLLVSLVTFSHDDPSKNLLGLIGYWIALGFLWLFGLGAYFIASYATWIGWRLLYSERVPAFPIRTFYFFIFLISNCLLLTVYAEAKGLTNPILQSRIFSESLTFKTPFLHKVIRYNLGGVPLYYLYKDLPLYSIMNLLSHIGTTLTFSITAFISFILLTGTSLLNTIKNIQRFYFAIRSFFKRVLRGFQPFPIQNKEEELSYSKMEEALSKPSMTAHPTWNPPSPSSSSMEVYDYSHEEDAYGPEEDSIVLEEEEILPVKVKEPQKKKYNLSIASTATIKSNPGYKLPSTTLLTNAKKIDKPTLKRDLRKQAEILEETLASFGIEAKVGEINCGPTITSFEVHPAIGVKVQKIKALENDIALNLQAKSIRIIAPIPGKAVVGVEIPSLYPQEVGFKEMLCSYQKQRRKFVIPVLLGKTVSGEDVVCDLTKMPHCIIAGATGSGKSVCINTIVMSILMNSNPDDIKLLLIDPKKVELSAYSSLPHMIAPVITEPHGAYAALQWLVKEMQSRYEILKLLGVRNITAFNERTVDKALEESLGIPIPEKMFYIVSIIDEFADLIMTSSTDLETPIARIAQMARAVGIHLILATQRPSREVITGLIKANFPTRIAFKVSSRINSQIILDENGAETLLGNGDLLFMPPGSSQLIRAQGAYICDQDINKIIDYNCKQASPNYLIKSFDTMSKEDFLSASLEESEAKDSLYDKALEVVTTSRNASTTFLQRKLKIGYARAASLMDELEEHGVIGPQEGSKPRKVLANPLDDFSFNPKSRF
jgi:DNA segregation ATPase FtsK/SpoIIIE, S-DNA-T family